MPWCETCFCCCKNTFEIFGINKIDITDDSKKLNQIYLQKPVYGRMKQQTNHKNFVSQRSLPHQAP